DDTPGVDRRHLIVNLLDSHFIMADVVTACWRARSRAVPADAFVTQPFGLSGPKAICAWHNAHEEGGAFVASNRCNQCVHRSHGACLSVPIHNTDISPTGGPVDRRCDAAGREFVSLRFTSLERRHSRHDRWYRRLIGWHSRAARELRNQG